MHEFDDFCRVVFLAIREELFRCRYRLMSVLTVPEAIAEENRPFGVHVFALCPGSTKTNFFEAGNIDTTFSFKGQQTPEEVVDAALKAVGSGRSKVTSG